MEIRIVDRVFLFIAVFGAIGTVAAFATFGPRVGVGALVGSLLSIGNWLVLRRVMRGLVRGSDRSRAGWTSVLVAKMIALIAAAWLLLAVLGIDAVGFAIGLSALVVGALLGSSSVADTVAADTALADSDSAEAVERIHHAAR